MSYKVPWQQPYPNISTAEKENVRRLTIELPQDDAGAIMSVAVNPAIFSLICQSALKQTAAYVRSNSLKYTDSERFIQWICQRTFSSPVEDSVGQNGPGGVEETRRGVENARTESAVVGKEVEGKGKGTGGRRRGGIDGPVVRIKKETSGGEKG